MRATFAQVDHGLSMRFVEAAPDHLGEKDPVIARVDVCAGLAFHVAQRVLQNWNAASAVRNFKTFERRRTWLEALGKALEQAFLTFADDVQDERLALRNPIAHIAAEPHRDADHRWLEAGLLHPAREHASRPRASPHGKNEDSARDLPDGRIVRLLLTHDVTIGAMLALIALHAAVATDSSGALRARRLRAQGKPAAIAAPTPLGASPLSAPVNIR
jgi:hypothetical protein